MRAKTFLNILMLMLLALCANSLYSQAPQGFSYQAVVRDGSGSPIPEKTVGVKITLQDASQKVLYTETHSPKTTKQGVISIIIGKGIQQGDSTFTSISWGNGDILIKVEIDPAGGTAYTQMGDPTKLQSVPYALYASSGLQGPVGNDGISINWLGSLSSAPSSPTLNQAYYSTNDKKSYIFNGSSWSILSQDGEQGDTGPLVLGTTGQTLYNNGTTWAATSSLINDGVNIGVGITPTQKLDLNGNLRLRGSLYDYNNSPGSENQLLTSGASGVQWQLLPAIGLPSGTGALGQVAYWNGTNTLQGLSNVTWASSLQVASNTIALPDDPIFEVKNKDGKVVFGVYQGGVRVNVDDAPIIKGARAGFAVGGLTNSGKVLPQEYFRITPDSARIYVNQTPNKGARGGFAVGGLTNSGKALSGNFLDLTSKNSFIGLDAGKSNTTGEQNAFIGYKAGLMNSNGWMNVFIGNESGSSNIDGSSNIFLGTSSGKSNTYGGNNIFLGSNSGEQNTTGVSNIAIGTYAGQNLKSGMKNIFIGVLAGASNVTGLDNVFIGNYAGNLNTASSNVFIGRTSGLSNTIGTNNVFIGEQSGRYNVEGSGNVFLGDQAGINEMGSNKLYISNSSTTAPLIYGEFDKGKIEINGAVKLKELINLKPSTTYPGDPEEGDVFYDANSRTIKYFNGTEWWELNSTKMLVSTPIVSTISIPLLSTLAFSCNVNFNISNQGSSPITQSGVRYSLSPFFVIQSEHVAICSTPGIGDLTVTITGLTQNKVYYVRSFATNSQGTSLGNMITFTTPSYGAKPTLTTNPVSDITQTTATCGGTVTAPGGTAVTAQGVCWSTSSNPLVTGSHTTDVAVLGVFTSSITGLAQNTVYYVRAYATNGTGTGYGNEVCFGIPGATGTVTDIDGNSYLTQVIGSQTWMAENLKTTKYCDGSDIPNITDAAVWTIKTDGAYCWYENDAPTYKNTYGALYNYYAVVDNRNLCPTGWHVPNDAEWTTLTNYLGGENVAGGLLKEAGTTHWISPNTGANNGSGFTALPSGYFYGQYGFGSIGYYGEWWSATEYDATNAWARDMGNNYVRVNRYGDFKNGGFSVRCLKD